MGDDSDLCKMKCWPFGIVEGCPKDKDERVEDWTWDVVPGMAIRITLWQESARGGKADKFKSSMNSDDHTIIPAFTVFEIEMCCKVRIHLCCKARSGVFKIFICIFIKRIN
jgi:hypothetical protein